MGTERLLNLAGGDSVRRALVSLAVVAAIAATLRGAFPTADPPWQTTVGITWHDEGPWVHNARNKVLFGTWSLDEWNPMYLSPVFTGLEYVSFSLFGVGTWQARLVSQVMGFCSVLLLGAGLAAVGGRRAALLGMALLATNYVYVMWNRAALMETTMTVFLVAAWAAYATAERRAAWGAAAGLAAVLAFFTKAAAAFFVAALAVEALWAILSARRAALPPSANPHGLERRARAGYWALGGLLVATLAALALFVAPHWSEFRFYNWQMSVTRKPAYTVEAIVDRASWVPIVHDFFTRQWLVTVLALAACLGLLRRWRAALPAERLLGLWVGLGLLELVVHDVGNERRFVFFIPAFVALAALTLGRDRRLLPPDLATLSRRARLVAAPAVLFVFYVVLGAVLRLCFLYQVRPGVRLSAGAAVVMTVLLYLNWPRAVRWLSAGPWSPTISIALVLLVMGGDLVQFAQWAASRSYENVTASRMIGDRLPPGTEVHGKLANGLALENQIRPVFVGRGFGNYEDRRRRPDIRFVLTYVQPRLGYEGPVILDVLEAHPGWRILHTFDVAETAGGADRAALIQKP